MKKTLLILLLLIVGCEDENTTNTSSGSNNGGNDESGAVYGCTNPNATNYNAEATLDDGSCEYASNDVYGCTNSNATNYNPEATVDDGSCEYASADVVVGISLDSGDCNNCNSGNPGGEGIMGVCYSCVQIILDYSVENIGTATAYNVKVRFKVEYAPFTNIQLPQTSWYSDIINLYTLNPDEITSGSIVAVDYSYWGGTHLTSYYQVRVYLDYLNYSD